MMRFNQDSVVFSAAFSQRLGEFLNLATFATVKGLLAIAVFNSSISLEGMEINEAEFSREKRKYLERETKEQRRQVKETRKRIEKDKKRFLRSRRKREGKKDRETEKMGLNLSHSSEERHLLLFVPHEVAQQLALLDSECFDVIPDQDMLHQSWAKRPLTSGVVQCIDNFNNISDWVITWIVKQHDIKRRLRTLLHILDIAQELFELGDFVALFAIASALSGAAISRLKDTLSVR
jgi:hypothetical protein